MESFYRSRVLITLVEHSPLCWSNYRPRHKMSPYSHDEIYCILSRYLPSQNIFRNRTRRETTRTDSLLVDSVIRDMGPCPSGIGDFAIIALTVTLFNFGELNASLSRIARTPRLLQQLVLPGTKCSTSLTNTND